MSEQSVRRDQEVASGQVGGFRMDADGETFAWTDGLCGLLHIDRGHAAPSLSALTASLHADDRRLFGEMLRIARANGHAQACEVRALADRGRPIRCRIDVQPELGADGEVAALIGIVQEIAERRPADDALGRNHSWLQAVIDAVPALISVTDADGRYVLVNAHSATYHGHAADWFPGKRIEDVHRPDYAQLLRERDTRTLRSDRPADPYEEVYTEADGRRTHWLSSDVPIQIGSGAAQYVVSVSLDITERKQTESAVRESRNLLRAIIDAVPLTIHVKDTDGRYVLVNADMAVQVQQPAESLIGKRIWDLFPEAYARQVSEREQHLIATGEATPLFEEEYRDHAGRSSTWLARKVPMRDEHGAVKYIVSAGLDITDRKTAEASVRESQSLLRAIIDAVPATVTVKDLQGRYILVNAYQAHYLGRPIEWFEGRSVADVYPAEYVRAIAERDRLVAETGQTQRFYETDYRNPDGELSSWIGIRAPIMDGDGKVRYVVSIGLDITDRRRSELALEQSERRFRHLVESTDVVPYTWDIDSRRFLYVGPQIERILGVRPEVLKYEEQWLAMILPEDREAARQHAAAFNQDPRDEYFEYRVLRPDGQVVWVRDIMKVETRDDGSRLGFGYIFDITESKSREQQLAQAQKMDALGKLTGGVAHDFNNLLTVILGSLELLELSVRHDMQGLARVRLASEAARRGADLTQRLLAFARQQMLAPRVVDVNECVAGMGELLRRALGESISVRMQLAADLWPVRVDPTWLESAVLNLAVNGRDAMPNGGTLTIETANQQFDETVSWQGTDIAPGRYVALMVSDTGTGMRPEILARAFDPFFTTKEFGKGTGLGLSMVYGFVKQSGGHVRIYSEVGLGTTVKIHLPAAGPAGDSEQAEPAVSKPVAAGQETILVVEDDDSVRGTIVAMLQSLGYRVLTAADGAAGLKAVEQHTEIAVLLTDVIMPGKLNGPALAREVARRQPGIRILYMSGYAENAFGPGGVQDTGGDLLAKPFTKGDLARKIRDILTA
jgi:two-component system, cell cycle sensor histidine kinase and response regulator CckA